MRAFWLDPYLWIHLAGLAALPIFLELCVIGLAIGDPILPVWLEVLLVAAAGIAPVLWMQWQRPFYIFSIVAVALKPEQLTEDQRRLLTLFKSQRNRFVSVGVAIVLLFVLRWIYDGAAIASEVAPALPGGRVTGLLLAAVGFLGSNLFLQVPVSVAGVMLTEESAFAKLTPHSLDQIRQSFTILGLQLRQILPPILVETPVFATASSEPSLGNVMPEVTKPEAQPEINLEQGTEAIVADLETELEELEDVTLPEVTEEDSVKPSDSGNVTDPFEN